MSGAAASAKAQGGLVLLGRFGAPHGLAGEIRLQSFTEDPLAVARYGPLVDAERRRRFALSRVRRHGKDMLVARVDGVTDRDGAQRLKGVELYAPRENLPAPAEDEFYLADLIGLAAETPDGARLGVVVAVRNFGAGDILEVAEAGGAETALYPFAKAVVPTVDLPGGRVVINPPTEVLGEASSPTQRHAERSSTTPDSEEPA
ncbi:MAG TPA: ribosome maturation factor RimM [Methylocystis sp.]|nr:ribosome maturation factor RimM [Methylocystis sp.]